MASQIVTNWVVFSALALAACTPQGDPRIPAQGLKDDFARSELGPLWNNTGGPYALRSGALRVQGARNRPLWLRRRLPHDVRIELDARSESEAGDIKVEVFGDGVSRAEQSSYTATSYVVILGGWNNSKNIIARMNEHGDDVVVGPGVKVQKGRTYHLTIERKGALLSVWVDGKPWMKLKDDEPLKGRGHDHFAFNNWESEVWFDNLAITPL